MLYNRKQLTNMKRKQLNKVWFEKFNEKLNMMHKDELIKLVSVFYTDTPAEDLVKEEVIDHILNGIRL